MRCSSRVALCLLLAGNSYAVTDEDGDGVRDLKDACPQTPKGFVVQADGCSKLPLSQLCLPQVNGDSFPQDCQLLNKPRVYFATASTDLAPSQWSVLAEIAHFLRTYPKTKLLLIGYTDILGSDKNNMTLSLARASRVRDILIQDYKILPNRLNIKGRGKASAVKRTLSNKSQYADDRKVEFWVNGNLPDKY